jgi:hypothetical protein
MKMGISSTFALWFLHGCAAAIQINELALSQPTAGCVRLSFGCGCAEPIALIAD